MAWTSKRYRFLNAIEVEEFHSARYGAPGQKRKKRAKPTPDQVEAQNRKNREKLARRRLRAHFTVNDYFTCLTYRKENRPADMAAAKEDFKKFIRKVQNEYKKRGEELRWMRNIEVGTKGAWHIHIIINRIPDTDVILTKCWTHGGIHNQLLYAKGEFRELAAYITKNPKTDKRLRESSYSTSRNLPLPEPEKKEHLTRATWKGIRVPPGWYLEKDSLEEGYNLMGYPYRHYTLLRLNRKEEGHVRGKRRDRSKPKRLPGVAGVHRPERAAPRKAACRQPGIIQKKQLHQGPG